MVALLWWPATTRQGVDFQQRTILQPLYLKAMDFIGRDGHYRLLAREIVQGATTDEARALQIYAWTRDHVRPVPPGLPVVDDHIWHIIIRGYGTDDQANDVFTTLCAYAGLSAFWDWLSTPERKVGLVVSFVKLEGRWVVFDPYHGRLWKAPDGRLADADALRRHPEWTEQGYAPLMVRGVPYRVYFEHLGEVQEPHPSRPSLQKPLFRLGYEIQRLFSGQGAR